MIGADLESISTHGWFAGDGKAIDLLVSIGTQGWYGITIEDLGDLVETADFVLIIKRLEEMGLQMSSSLQETVRITSMKDFELKR
jgi:hypothetical protein